MHGALRGNSFADETGQVESGSRSRGALSLRRTRWLCLGVHERAGNAVTGDGSCRTGAAGVQQEIQDYASGVRAAVAYRPRDHRFDGPGAWALCAPIVVLAKPGQHSRKGKGVRADSVWISHEPAFAQLEQRAVPIAEENDRRGGDHDD